MERSGASCSDGRLVASNADVVFGQSATQGTETTVTITPEMITIDGGSFSMDPSIDRATFVVDPNVNDGLLSATFSTGRAVFIGGALVHAPTGRLIRAFVEPLQADTILPPVLQQFTAAPVVVSAELREAGLFLELSVGEPVTLRGTIGFDGSYRFGVEIVDLPIGDPASPGTLTARGSISATSFDVDPVVELSGSVVGPMALAPGLSLTSASVQISGAGLSASAELMLSCANGSLRLTGDLGYRSQTDWSAGISGSVASGGCVVAEGLTLDDGLVNGTLTAAGAGAKGDLTVDGHATIPGLPTGLQAWTIKIDGTLAAAPPGASPISGRVEITAPSASFVGSISTEGVFELAGQLDIRLGAETVSLTAAVSGSFINPSLTASGSIRLASNGITVAGSLALTPDGFQLTGTASVACDPGVVEVGLDATIPVTGDWSVTVSGSVGSGGCQLNPDVRLESASFTGRLSSTDGQLRLEVSAAASVVTRDEFIPTAGSTYSGSVSLDVSSTGAKVTLDLTGPGVVLSGSVDIGGDGRFFVTVTGGLRIKGTAVDFAGTISRTSDGLSSSFSGSITGGVQLTENFRLDSASFRWQDGSFVVDARVTISCTRGSLAAAAAGHISGGDTWDFSVDTSAPGCVIGDSLELGAAPFTGSITSVQGVVNGTFSVSVARWDVAPGVVISNVDLRLDIINGERLRGAIAATASVSVVLFSFFRISMGATATIGFDMDSRGTGNVEVGLSGISINWLYLWLRPSLEVRLQDGIVTGLSVSL